MLTHHMVNLHNLPPTTQLYNKLHNIQTTSSGHRRTVYRLVLYTPLSLQTWVYLTKKVCTSYTIAVAQWYNQSSPKSLNQTGSTSPCLIIKNPNSLSLSFALSWSVTFATNMQQSENMFIRNQAPKQCDCDFRCRMCDHDQLPSHIGFYKNDWHKFKAARHQGILFGFLWANIQYGRFPIAYTTGKYWVPSFWSTLLNQPSLKP